MPLLTDGPLCGMYLPDYEGGSIVNLLATLIRARGGHSPHAELHAVSSASLSESKNLYYLVLDGLGAEQLARHLSCGQGKAFLGQHPHTTLSTVFPATTAAAVTTFSTGASPSEHAILGWFLHHAELGGTATVLRSTSRMGTPFFPPGFDLGDYYRVPSYVQSVRGPLGLISFGDIPSLPFSSVGTAFSHVESHTELETWIDSLVAFDARNEGALVYAYWPTYDSLCHEFGCSHPRVDAHFDELDRALGRLCDALSDSGSTICIVADHGLVDIPPSRRFDLRDHGEIASSLTLLASGDQRHLSCFVRPRHVGRFLDAIERDLADACVCVPGEVLLAIEAYGPGPLHPALESRIGDYVLLARPGYALMHTPLGLEPQLLPGCHGGMSATEILVPLYVVSL